MSKFIVQVFNKEDEIVLADYLHSSADIYFGLSPIDVRKLAYLVAKKLNLKIPSSWTEKLAAGPDWFASFLKRHPTLAIRKLEATSLARTSSFHIHNSNLFFENYQRGSVVGPMSNVRPTFPSSKGNLPRRWGKLATETVAIKRLFW